MSAGTEPRSRGMRGLVGRSPIPAGAAAGRAGAPPAGTGTARSVAALTQDSLLLRLAAFAALAGFATAHWAMLVENAPAGRTQLVVLVATGGAAVLGLLGLTTLPRPLLHALALIVGVGTVALGLMAAGLPGRLLLPAHWSELTDGLDRGLAGVQGVDWPYDGADAWIRRTVLLGAPALLAIAAMLAFWPARRGAPALRTAGLVALLLLYGMAVTEHDPGAPALRGLVLLLLIAGWLWLPRMPRLEAGIGAAVVLSVGVVSLPLAAALDADRPWWNYHAWNWFGNGESITFDWTHEYGPLNWSRAGATVLNVKSDRPHYWKAEALDAFDGLRWVRSPGADDNRYGPEVAFSGSVPEGAWNYNEYNPKWDERIRFTVRSLSSDMVVGAGVTLRVDGISGARPSGDGTTRLRPGRKLERGDSYFVRTYAPNPTKAQMERVPEGYTRNLIGYTGIQLPNPGESATEGVAFQGDAARQQAALHRPVVFVPLRGNADPDNDRRIAERAIRRSPYERMYDLTQELTANQPTAYAAVKNVERYLQDTYTYSERVPTRPIPLMGFLYQERRGYCQQFSGAMALMLRMAGIPARVAAGFSPGSFNRDTSEYRVRDLDAHSWVEVWFQGIGWVPFDPTPARSPAQSQSSALATSAAAADAGEVRQTRQGVAAERTDTGASLGSDGGNGWLVPVLLLLVAAPLGAGAFLLGLRVRRLRSLSPEQLAELQLSELRRGLLRLGWDLPASTTLLGLERRLGRFAGPASEAYAEALRANRYDPRAPEAPGLGERRVVRRELTRGSVVDRLRGLLAFPPGAPRI